MCVLFKYFQFLKSLRRVSICARLAPINCTFSPLMSCLLSNQCMKLAFTTKQSCCNLVSRACACLCTPQRLLKKAGTCLPVNGRWRAETDIWYNPLSSSNTRLKSVIVLLQTDPQKQLLDMIVILCGSERKYVGGLMESQDEHNKGFLLFHSCRRQAGGLKLCSSAVILQQGHVTSVSVGWFNNTWVIQAYKLNSFDITTS